MTTLVSLFDGIGGFCLAFQRAGAQIVATVEIDVAAAGVSRRHFPNAAQFDDIRNVSADDLRAVGFVPERGIVTAGWPCQDFSVAGRRAGLDGARSGLWWEVARILAELRPRWFLGENVPGLLSSVCTPECEGGCMETHGGAMGAVLGSLADLGYGVAYRVLDAQHFGVPQRRERVFIVGHLGAPWTAPAEVLFEPESSAGDSEAGRTPWPHIAPCLESGSNSTGGTRPPGTTVDTAESLVVVPALVARYASGRASHRGAVAALTSNGVGTCGPDDNQAQAGHLIAEVAYQCHGSNVGEMGTLRQGNGAVTGGVPFVVQPLAIRGREGGAMLEIGPEGGPYNALRAGDGGSSRQSLVCITEQRAHTLTTEGADASEDGTGRGTPIATAFAFTPSRDVAQSLTANYGKQVDNSDASLGPTLAHTDTIVRRLTELECERLQGYPDGWTDGQSGSARYRQLGNSVAVPVVEWIARRLMAVDRELGA